MSFLKGPLLVMAGMIIPLQQECEIIVDPLLLGNTETMDHLLVLVYVTMMSIEEALQHLHLNETGLLLPLILGVVILLRWTPLIVVMALRRHRSMTVMNGGQTKNIRQLILSPPGQGHVPLQGQGKITTESHPGTLSTYFSFQSYLLILEYRDYPEYRRPATPPRYAPEYPPRLTNDSPATRYRLVSVLSKGKGPHADLRLQASL
jgi:hypothetical protein